MPLPGRKDTLMKKKLDLFWTMLKIGLFTFGGGYAMIALLENEFISKKNWMERTEFLDMVAIAESTPGPIAINAATYIGYKTAGFGGSLLATIGVCIPSFVIIYTISLFFDAFLSFAPVAYAFQGIKVCVVFLIFSAGLKLLKGIPKTRFNCFILIAVAACIILFTLFSISFSTVYLILICGGLGIFCWLLPMFLPKKEGK